MIIAISGKKQSGKNTVSDMIADILDKKRDIEIEEGSFAKILKEFLAKIIGVDSGMFEDEQFKTKSLGEEFDIVDKSKIESKVLYSNITPRFLMEYVGTELIRKQWNKNIWVYGLLNKYKEIRRKYNFDNKQLVFVVSDLRFRNELEIFKREERNLYTIRVVRNEVAQESKSESETDLDNYKDWDYVIYNNGTEIDLRKEVEKALLKFNIIS